MSKEELQKDLNDARQRLHQAQAEQDYYLELQGDLIAQ